MRKIISQSFLLSQLGFAPHEGVILNQSRARDAMHLSHPVIKCTTGVDAGELLTGDKLVAGRSYRLQFGICKAVETSAMLLPSPHLISLPVLISSPTILVYGDGNVELSLTLQALKQVLLSDLNSQPVARLCLLD